MGTIFRIHKDKLQILKKKYPDYFVVRDIFIIFAERITRNKQKEYTMEIYVLSIIGLDCGAGLEQLYFSDKLLARIYADNVKNAFKQKYPIEDGWQPSEYNSEDDKKGSYHLRFSKKIKEYPYDLSHTIEINVYEYTLDKRNVDSVIERIKKY